MKLEDLLKKIYALKDLRMAIREVKSLNKGATVIPLKPTSASSLQMPMGKEPQREEAKGQLQAFNTDVKHNGIKTNVPGVMTHMIGIPGSRFGYEVDYNMHNASQGKPHFNVKHVNANTGEVLSQHPELHNNIGSAVKSLVHHAFHGEWK